MTTDVAQPDDGSWLVEFRDQLLLLAERPDPAAKKASDLYFAMLGALSRSQETTDDAQRRKLSEQAIELSQLATDSLMSYRQTALSSTERRDEDRAVVESLNAQVLKVRQS